jgi:sugar transferase (PEP-CTERM/EpsH1 system associated)
MDVHCASRPRPLPASLVRCLILSPFVPFPPEDGGRIRILELMKGLAERYDVDLLTLSDGGDAAKAGCDELQRLGFTVEPVEHLSSRTRAALSALMSGRSFYGTLFWTDKYLRALTSRVESGGYDVVQCEFPYTGQYRQRVQTGRERWVLDEHNVEFALSESLSRVEDTSAHRLYRAYSDREAAARRREELAVCRLVDRIITVSESDRALLERAVPGLRVSVVPNGVDLERFSPMQPDASGGASAVFVGKLDYRPNVDAITWFCRAVLPLIRREVPSFTLTVVGRDSTKAVLSLARIPGVEIRGRVEDTRPVLQAATLAVLPLRAGSGTRLKLLEALAMARPVVATTPACAGIDVVTEKHLLIADSADEFAAAVLRLLADPALGARLGREGRALVAEHYGWPIAVRKLTQVYEELETHAEATPVLR